MLIGVNRQFLINQGSPTWTKVLLAYRRFATNYSLFASLIMKVIITLEPAIIYEQKISLPKLCDFKSLKYTLTENSNLW